MELFVIPKGSKYLVQDNKGRIIYTIKKKGFGYKYIIHDASDYALFTMVGDFSDRHPVYDITLNGNLYLWVKCQSRFLEPSILAKGNDGDLLLRTEDKLTFQITKDGENVGSIVTQKMPNGDAQYAFNISDKVFDDALPLLALCVDSSFTNYKK